MKKPIKIRITVANTTLLCMIFIAIYAISTVSASNQVKKEYNQKIQEIVEKNKSETLQKEAQYTQKLNELEKCINDLNSEVEVLNLNNQNTQSLLKESDAKFKKLWNSLDSESKKKFEVIQTSPLTASNRGGGMGVIHLTGTAYSITMQDCGKLDGITASGRKVKDNWTIAVDPKVIPLGSILYLEFPVKFAHMNGYYRAQDVGGAIKGYRVDVFISDVNKAKAFGVVPIKATIIEVPKGKYVY